MPNSGLFYTEEFVAASARLCSRMKFQFPRLSRIELMLQAFAALVFHPTCLGACCQLGIVFRFACIPIIFGI